LQIIIRRSDSGAEIASATFPIVYGQNEFNCKQQGVVPLICCESLQCIGHMKLVVRISFPHMSSFEALECHIGHSSGPLYVLHQGKTVRDSSATHAMSGSGPPDVPDAEANAILERVSKLFSLNKRHEKGEDPVAQQADICALVHAACLRCESGDCEQGWSSCISNIWRGVQETRKSKSCFQALGSKQVWETRY
jgi:hypothetical protein